MYKCQYVTIKSSISACEHKSETQIAELEIGTDRSSRTQQYTRVDQYLPGFGLSRVSWLGFWMGLELNRPIFAVQTWTTGGLPRLVANTRQYYTILSLGVICCDCTCLFGGGTSWYCIAISLGGNWWNYTGVFLSMSTDSINWSVLCQIHLKSSNNTPILCSSFPLIGGVVSANMLLI